MIVVRLASPFGELQGKCGFKRIDHVQFAESFIGANGKVLSVCEYFLISESILFRESLDVSLKRSFNNLADEIRCTSKGLMSQVGPSSSYDCSSTAAHQLGRMSKKSVECMIHVPCYSLCCYAV